MLKSKKASLALALILAIGLWIYVFGSGSTMTTTVLRSVPITFQNVEALEKQGLTVLSTDISSISITFAALRANASGVKSDDFSVVADLQGLPEGETKIGLEVSGPSDINIESVSHQSVTIVVDELVSESKDISVNIVNDTSDETEPYIVQLSKEKVKAKGPKTLVDSVVSVQANLDATKVSDEMQAINVGLAPVDKNGKKVDGVSLSTNNVSITSVLLDKKTVNLNVPVEGEETERYSRTIELPKAITIKGVRGDISGVSAIDCEPIDITEVFENTTLEIKPILPAGVQIASDSADLNGTVTVSKAKAQEFDITASDISFVGVTAKTKVIVPELEVKAIAGGETKVIDSLELGQFSLSADLSGLEHGEHTVPLNIDCEVEVDMLKCEPGEITITIE